MLIHNLLPESHKKRMSQEIVARVFMAGSIVLVTWLVLFGVVLGGIHVVMRVNQNIADAQLAIEKDKADTQEVEAFESQISEFNAMLGRINSIRKTEQYDVYSLLNITASLVPPGANLTLFSLDVQKGTLNLQGHADFRAQVVALEDALKNESSFAEVTAPLSNLQRAQDINFVFDISLAPPQGEQ